MLSSYASKIVQKDHITDICFLIQGIPFKVVHNLLVWIGEETISFVCTV